MRQRAKQLRSKVMSVGGSCVSLVGVELLITRVCFYFVDRLDL
jgi:hypothetical protein